LIFQARGRTREQIVDALRARRADAGEDAEASAPPAEPLPALADLLGSFYQVGPDLDAIQAHIAAPEIDSALLKRYGPAPADTDSDLRAIYSAVTAWALERVLGD
jgi:uncharacterized Zn finger protein